MYVNLENFSIMNFEVFIQRVQNLFVEVVAKHFQFHHERLVNGINKVLGHKYHKKFIDRAFVMALCDISNQIDVEYQLQPDQLLQLRAIIKSYQNFDYSKIQIENKPQEIQEQEQDSEKQLHKETFQGFLAENLDQISEILISIPTPILQTTTDKTPLEKNKAILYLLKLTCEIIDNEANQSINQGNSIKFGPEFIDMI